MREKFKIRKILIPILIMVISHQTAFFLAHAFNIQRWIQNIIFGILYVGLACLLTKVASVKIFKKELKDLYIPKIKIKPVWILVSFLLPISVSITFLLIGGDLTKNNLNIMQTRSIITNAIFSAGFGAGIVEEIVFRGMIMKSFEESFGKKVAIIVPSFIFSLFHISGQDLDFISIILVILSITSIAILLSLVVYESKSVWNSVIIHIIWNIIIIGEIFNISGIHNKYVIFSFVINSKNILITGGDFGIESSIISILLSILFSVFTYTLIKRRKRIQK